MKRVFISYRRDDAAGHAGRLCADLQVRYGQEAVFMDIAAIEPGEDFRNAISNSLKGCFAVIAVIGRRWLEIRDKDGRVRLLDPRDLVRSEICTALEMGIRVIPVLVDGARMPYDEEVPEPLKPLLSRNALEITDSRWPYDFGQLAVSLDKLARASESDHRTAASNGPSPTDKRPKPKRATIPYDIPYSWRGGITQEAQFFGRRREQDVILRYLKGRSNCQIVGPRRIGKTSLLLQAERLARGLGDHVLTSYVDFQDPHCNTLRGWMGRVGGGFGWGDTPETLSSFTDRIEDMIDEGFHPVLLVDEFGEITRRGHEFMRDFLLALRYCGQHGLSILTAAHRNLSELTDPEEDTSPFFNTLPVLRLAGFSSVDASDFVNFERPGILPFTPEQKAACLAFAQGHPLALQVCCFELAGAGTRVDEIQEAVRSAGEVMRSLLPSWKDASS